MALPIPCVGMASRQPIFPLALFSSHPAQSHRLISYTRNVVLHRNLSVSCSAMEPFWSRELAIWNVGAAVAVEAETKAEIVAVPDTPESQFISILLLFAFAGLTFLSFGVIYLSVKDYQEKREREKLLKQEEAREKRKDSKKPKLAKSGPRGFGQKIGQKNRRR